MTYDNWKATNRTMNSSALSRRLASGPIRATCTTTRVSLPAIASSAVRCAPKAASTR